MLSQFAGYSWLEAWLASQEWAISCCGDDIRVVQGAGGAVSTIDPGHVLQRDTPTRGPLCDVGTLVVTLLPKYTRRVYHFNPRNSL